MFWTVLGNPKEQTNNATAKHAQNIIKAIVRMWAHTELICTVMKQAKKLLWTLCVLKCKSDCLKLAHILFSCLTLMLNRSALEQWICNKYTIYTHLPIMHITVSFVKCLFYDLRWFHMKHFVQHVSSIYDVFMCNRPTDSCTSTVLKTSKLYSLNQVISLAPKLDTVHVLHQNNINLLSLAFPFLASPSSMSVF